MLIGVGEEVERKLMHWTVYVKLLLSKLVAGQIYKLEKPPETSTAAKSWLKSLEPVVE